jgi:hypothetical protein
VIVIQLTLLVAVHAQLDPVMTEMLLLLPADGTDTFVGDTEYVHCASAGRASSAKASASRTQQDRTVIDPPLGIPGTSLPGKEYGGRRISRAARSGEQVAVMERLTIGRCAPAYRICEGNNEIAITFS